MPNDQQNKASPTMLWILWGAMLMSLFIYLLVLYMVTSKADQPPQTDPELISTLLMAFAGISVVEIVGIFVARKMMFLDKLSGENAFDSLKTLRGTYMTSNILSWALSESVAIYGFVLAFLTHELVYYLAFLAPAVVLYVVLRPQPKRFEEQFLRGRPAGEPAEAAESGPDGEEASEDDASVW